MTTLNRLFHLISTFRRNHVSFRLDRYEPEGLTVTFVWADHLIEVAHYEDKILFSKFALDPRQFDDPGLLDLIAQHWGDGTGQSPVKKREWLGIEDPFSRMFAFLEMLDDEGITWRMDAFDDRSITIFFTLVSVRVEAVVGTSGMAFRAFIGSEDVFPETDLAAVTPGLQLDF